MDSVAVITPPAALVSLALAKKQVRVDAANTDEDDLITLQIAAASAAIDGPAGWLGRAVGVQTLELRLESFRTQAWCFGSDWTGWENGTQWAWWSDPMRFAAVELPFPPLISVTSITYEDQNGVDQVLDPSGWNAVEGEVAPAFGAVWPSGRITADAIRIRYQAGYATVPAPIQAAVLLMVGDLYANREADVIDARAVVAVNPTVENLLSPYRVWRC